MTQFMPIFLIAYYPSVRGCVLTTKKPILEHTKFRLPIPFGCSLVETGGCYQTPSAPYLAPYQMDDGFLPNLLGMVGNGCLEVGNHHYIHVQKMGWL